MPFQENFVACARNRCISPALETRKNADCIRTRVHIQKCRFAPDKQVLRRRVLYPAELYGRV